jgi:hypothetical protein
MGRLSERTFPRSWPSLAVVALVGCTQPQFTTYSIYDTPHAFVHLQVDRTLEPEAGHSHPASVSTDQMAAVLRGIVVLEPLTRMPIYDDLSTPRRHRAFAEDAVEFWAPLLTLALRTATPEELVTFYQSTRVSGTRREVTSGGLFVDGDELHVVLSNLRSSTHYTADIGVADTEDDRLTPMRSIAPQRGKLAFSPESASRDPAPGGMGRVFYEDRRELIVLFKTIQPDPPNATAEHPPEPENPQRRPR